jgi:hypothetical protein
VGPTGANLSATIGWRLLWGEGDFSMYCDKCRRQIYYKDPNNHGWCFTCGNVVDIAKCKISQWSLFAVFTMLWTLQV